MQVTVIGLLRPQQRLLAKLCPGVKLRAFAAGTPAERYTGDGHAVIVAKFAGHKDEDAAKVRFPPGCVHVHRGGIKRLAALVRGLAQLA